MRPLRKNVAISIDGGGIKGIVVTRALAIVESYLRQPLHRVVGLATGTSTGAIISAALAMGLTAQQMYELYVAMGSAVFRKSWRTRLWPLVRFKYPLEPLEGALQRVVGDITMAELWTRSKGMDLVITAFDLVENRTRFFKPWKAEYARLPLRTAVLASCAVPTYFPVVAGRFVDGGVGSYGNPCYLAAFELQEVLHWHPAETTLISVGTGRAPSALSEGEAERLWPWDWIGPALGAFQHSADDQQVHLVDTFYDQLDFRRFQVDLRAPIDMDDATQVQLLTQYGDELGRKILADEVERPVEFRSLPGGVRYGV